jgi:hypothetical protein
VLADGDELLSVGPWDGSVEGRTAVYGEDGAGNHRRVVRDERLPREALPTERLRQWDDDASVVMRTGGRVDPAARPAFRGFD